MSAMKAVDPWKMPRARRQVFWAWAMGDYLGGMDEVTDGAPRELLALERFEDERLKKVTPYVTEDKADRWAVRMTRKACAGRRPDATASGPELRRGIRRGHFTAMERATYLWTLSGIWTEHLYQLYAYWRVSIFDLARIDAVEFEGKLAMSAWLNLWGADPARGLPDGYDGLSLRERARTRGFAVKDSRLCDAQTGAPVEVAPGPWRR